MSPLAAHQSSWETSEVVFGIPLVISILLGLIWSLPMSHGLLRWLLLPVGIALMLLGVYLIAAARRELARHGQPTDPGKPTSSIVTSGIYSISRNPLYLAIVVLVVGFTFALNSWWILILLVPEIFLCHYVLIFPEERYLSSTFGETYQAYRQTVHRWFGRARK